jgi:AraC family transcriptional activator of pobA
MKFIHQIDSLKFVCFELSRCPESYLQSSVREGFFEIIWYKHALDKDVQDDQPSHYVYLIPPYRSSLVRFEDKEGYLIAFKRDYLEEDDKEYALDVFNLFNIQGQYTHLPLNTDATATFQHLQALIEKEYFNPLGTYLVLKALLKVFLLNLIRINQSAFLNQDVNQKRVYHYIMLMEEHYKTERKANFYSGKLGVSEKRLNQILKEKMNKTLTQLLHERLIVQAKRMLLSSEQTIKEIAFDLNFEDPAYFSRFFKKQTGQSPEDFKRAIL